MVQFQINVPAKNKANDPTYQAIKYAIINRVELPTNAGAIEDIAGEYKGTKGSATTFTSVNLFNAKLKKRGKADFYFPVEYSTVLLST